MLIPYSTDAPIYHFPWMTIVLIVANAIAFAITGMGSHNVGWILTYGRGLHPLEWVAYNFLHFGPIHLVGNMFFLWAFGIVVEGKLGWWKYLTLYLSIGIVGGILIQIAMLGHVNEFSADTRRITPAEGLFWNDNPVYAQEFDDGLGPGDMDDDEPVAAPGNGRKGDNAIPRFDPKQLPGNGGNPNNVDGDADAEQIDGAGGASLIIYGLMAIVLVWAPRNEIHCLWIGMRSGTFEIEYLWFCGFYIIVEILSAVFSSSGFVMTSEVGHAVGAIVGFGLGTLFVKTNWVDCENWDLYSIISGAHYASMRVGDWQNDMIVRSSRKKDWIAVSEENASDDSGSPGFRNKKKKKAKAKPKLMELESLDDSFDESPMPIDEAPVPKKTRVQESAPRPKTAPADSPQPLRPSRPRKELPRTESPPDVDHHIREKIQDEQFSEAFDEFRECRAADAGFELAEADLRDLADGLFKAKAARHAAMMFEICIKQFPESANHERVKLSVLYVKFLRRPTAALKVLTKVDADSLPDNYRAIYRKAIKDAQQMIADGTVDARDPSNS